MNRLESLVTAWAETEENVRALALVGSRARTETPADEWSDYDFVVLARDPDALLERDDWARAFGELKLTFLEPTGTGDGRERRALYEDGTDADFAILPLETIDDRRAGEVVARGIRLLVDKDDAVARRLADVAPRGPSPPPGELELRELVHDFFYHAVWAARKLRRGEVFTAKGAVDGYMKALLLRLLEWHARARDPAVDTWHRGRFLERWADPRALEELREAYAHYDGDDVRRALFATMELFRRLARDTAHIVGSRYSDEADDFASSLTEALLKD